MNPVPAAQVVSIVATATHILQEELPSLAMSGIGQVPGALSSTIATIPGPFGGGPQPLVDALAQLLKVPVSSLLRVMAPTAAVRGDGDRHSQTIRVLRASLPVAAGEVTRLSLILENDDDQPDDCELYVTDLVGPSGARLPASHVHVSPNPTRLPAHGSTAIRIEVRIPSGTAHGWYTGLLQADDGEALRALVQVHVGQ